MFITASKENFLEKYLNKLKTKVGGSISCSACLAFNFHLVSPWPCFADDSLTANPIPAIHYVFAVSGTVILNNYKTRKPK